MFDLIIMLTGRVIVSGARHAQKGPPPLQALQVFCDHPGPGGDAARVRRQHQGLRQFGKADPPVIPVMEIIKRIGGLEGLEGCIKCGAPEVQSYGRFELRPA